MATTTATMRRTLRLRLTCLEPPTAEGAEFGLQDRQRAIELGRRQADETVSYEFGVTAFWQGQGEAIRFSGPQVHGTPATPFLYLSLKRLGEHPEPWILRLKVPLPALTWAQVEALPPDALFAARVSGSRSGTVPLLGDGWARQDAD